MSLPKEINVTCPKCGCEYSTRVFESINTDFSPDVVKEIMNGEIFKAHCPHCNFAAFLEYDLLYNDLKNQAAIWVKHKNNPKYQEEVKFLRSAPFRLYNQTRIVNNINELREKVSCLESGKDDRIIELCKYITATQFMEQKHDFKVVRSLYAFIAGKGKIFLYNKKDEEILCDLDDSLYNMIKEQFLPAINKFCTQQYDIIDYDWAERFIIYYTENQKTFEAEENESE